MEKNTEQPYKKSRLLKMGRAGSPEVRDAAYWEARTQECIARETAEFQDVLKHRNDNKLDLFVAPQSRRKPTKALSRAEQIQVLRGDLFILNCEISRRDFYVTQAEFYAPDAVPTLQNELAYYQMLHDRTDAKLQELEQQRNAVPAQILALIKGGYSWKEINAKFPELAAEFYADGNHLADLMHGSQPAPEADQERVDYTPVPTSPETLRDREVASQILEHHRRARRVHRSKVVAGVALATAFTTTLGASAVNPGQVKEPPEAVVDLAELGADYNLTARDTTPVLRAADPTPDRER